MILPKAKLDNIVVQDLRDELLVYNLTTHQAFTLNETLKIVYQSCDGQTTFDDLKRRYKFADDLIHLALDELAANDLLIDYTSDHFKGLSRREAVKRVGLASMIALPVIAAMIAPQASNAASGARGADGSPCTSGNQCASDMCSLGKGECCSVIGTGPACTFDGQCCDGRCTNFGCLGAPT